MSECAHTHTVLHCNQNPGHVVIVLGELLILWYGFDYDFEQNWGGRSIPIFSKKGVENYLMFGNKKECSVKSVLWTGMFRRW